MKVFAEIGVPEPENTIDVVEALIGNSCAVVIRANGHDEGGPTIFVHAYDVLEFAEDEGIEATHDHYKAALAGTGGDLLEAGFGHTDIERQVPPPHEGLAFAVDVRDDASGILRRLSCAEYSRDRFCNMMIEAAELLANTSSGSVGNALARRLLLAALGVADEVEDEDEVDVEEPA